MSRAKFIAGEQINLGDLVCIDKSTGKFVKASSGQPPIGVLPVKVDIGEMIEIDYSTTPPTIRNLGRR